MFDNEWKKIATPYLMMAFEGFRPRSEYLTKNKLPVEIKSVQEEQANILGINCSLAPPVENLLELDQVWRDCPGFEKMQHQIDLIVQFMKTQIKEAKAVFVTFSTDVTGAQQGLLHLHPKLNGNGCNTWSYGIPLYVGKKMPSFVIHLSRSLWPARLYLDYDRIKKLSLKFTRLCLPDDGSIFNLRFNGSFHPHYITYTDSVVMWLVFDGVTFLDEHQIDDRISIGYFSSQAGVSQSLGVT